jgi:GT2 family glycosyltransferase
MDCKNQNSTFDALPGRGVLIPMRSVFQVGNVNARVFPHYLCDVEYTARISESGWRILVSKKANVYSSSVSSDVQIRNKGFFSKYFSFGSKNNLLHRIFFFSVRGPVLLRILALPRLPFTLIKKYVGNLYVK